MTKNVLCFGDSNTFGYIAGSGERYSKDVRWTALLGELLGNGYKIFEGGCNNRACFVNHQDGEKFIGKEFVKKYSKYGIDLIVSAIGTNDLQKFYNPSIKELEAGFEEYIDVVHFALMYEIKFGTGCYQDEDIKWNYNKLKTDLGFGQAYAFSCVISLTRDDNVLAYVIALGLHMGFSLEEIYNEYIRKNEINKERLAKGY